MATQEKNAGESDAKDNAVPKDEGKGGEAEALKAAPARPQKEASAPVKASPSKYPAVRVLSGAELDAYKNQKVDVEQAERFLAQKDKEEYWRNKKAQKHKKPEGG